MILNAHPLLPRLLGADLKMYWMLERGVVHYGAAFLQLISDLLGQKVGGLQLLAVAAAM